MSTERDTHFTGFANLLMQEIDEQVGAVAEWGIKHDIDSQEKIGRELYSRWQTIIAQRAYDLLDHASQFVMVSPEDVPDLTQWPDTSEQ